MKIGSFIDNLMHLDRMCPYCGQLQGKKPTRKKKCESCGKYFRVLSHPDTKEISLVTEETAIKYQAIREQLSVDRDSARMAEAKRLHAEWLKGFKRDLKRMHDTFPFVQFLSEGDESTCPACSQHDNKIYHFKNMPEMPVKGCTCAHGCMCQAVMLTEEDARRAVRP
jgi:transposase-like protein